MNQDHFPEKVEKGCKQSFQGMNNRVEDFGKCLEDDLKNVERCNNM